jgi:uncharacterized protein YdeI (YjbR/CyaY-like superfamily)
MGTKDPRIDAYIANAGAFAQPILTHLRDAVHAASPAIEETIKWSSPHFTYNGMLCSMAAFKQHCAFGFWKGKLVVDDTGTNFDEAMGQFGRIENVRDLPPKRTLTAYVKKAMTLNEAGVKSPTRAKRAAPRAALPVPDDLAVALKKNRKAAKTFDAFSPSHRREYIEWITEAKREATRAERLATAIGWLAEGKTRHWKYAAC